MSDPEAEGSNADRFDFDVVIVGGGPAGCSAGVFCAREGLETAIFDRGRSSLKRCAHLENYLGFPAGIDVETLYGLIHEHAETAGCEIVPDLVESIERSEGDVGFVVKPQEGTTVIARRVVAATRYDGEYMRGLDDDEAMFRTYEHDGEEHETFDNEYADRDGATPVDGLYIATPARPEDKQAIMAAGRGARAARTVITDARIDRGWWEDVAEGVDWVRREAELDERWADRDEWIEWFDERHAEDAPVDPGTERFERVREAAIEESLSSYIPTGEIDARRDASHSRLAAHLDAEAVVDAVGEEALLEAIDDETIRERADSIERTERHTA